MNSPIQPAPNALDRTLSFGQKISLYRRAAGHTQLSLATAIGRVTAGAISNWECRGQVPEPETLALVAAELAPEWCPLEQFLTYLTPVGQATLPREELDSWIAGFDHLIAHGRIAELTSEVSLMYTSFGGHRPLDRRMHDRLSRIFLEHKRYQDAIREVNLAEELRTQTDPVNWARVHRGLLAQVELGQIVECASWLDANDELLDNPEFAGLAGRVYLALADEAEEPHPRLADALKAYTRAFKASGRTSYYMGSQAALVAFRLQVADGAPLASEVLSLCLREDSFWARGTAAVMELALGHVDAAAHHFQVAMEKPHAPREEASVLRGLEKCAEWTGHTRDTVARVTSNDSAAPLADLNESLARHVHNAWMKTKLEAGWTHGETLDAEKRHHPSLVRYEILPESEKDIDRDVVRAVLAGLEELDFTVSPRTNPSR